MTKQATQSNDEIMTRISMARTTLMNSWPFMGFLTLSLRPRVAAPEDKIPTAGVAPDGTLYLNADFVSSLTQPQLAGLLAHEVMHPALDCWRREAGRKAIIVFRDPVTKQLQPVSLWNVAHDMSFNTMIDDFSKGLDGEGKQLPGQQHGVLELPPDPAMDAKYRNWAAEQIYDDLLDQARENSKKGGKGKGQGYGAMILDRSSGMGEDMRADLSSTPTGQKAAAGDPLSQKALDNEWKLSLVAAAQMQEKSQQRGTLPAWLKRVIQDIVEPKLDWREELGRWVGENGRRSDYTFKRPSRRSEAAGEYLPAIVNQGYCTDVTVLIDTSGSRSDDETKEALSEVYGVCDDLGITVRAIICDAAVHEDVMIESVEELFDKLAGGGGSDFDPAFDRLDQENYEGCVIAFTDGAIKVPATQPVHIRGTLWVLSKGHDTDPTGGRWGEVIRLCDHK